MTDDATVERVAEAIWRNATVLGRTDTAVWADVSDVSRQRYRRMACAAVAALELTEERNASPHFQGWTHLVSPWRPPEDPPEWVTRPVADGTPDIAAMDAQDVAQWQQMETRAAEIARDTFDRGQP